MNEWQKAADRLHHAAEKYMEAVDAEQNAFRELTEASNALDGIKSKWTRPNTPAIGKSE